MATTSAGLNYVGNPDFRGYLNYSAQQGDPMAQFAISSGDNKLGFVDNTGKVTADDGMLGQWLGGNTAADTASSVSNFKNYVNNAYSTFNNLTNPGTGTTDSTNTNAQDLAYLDDQDNSLRAQLARASTALDQGLTTIGDSYNENANRTNQDKATADTGFNTNRTQTTQDKLKAIDTVNTGARTLSDSIRRILGQASGSTSSAYKVAAPALIARDTTTKRTGINDTFARNYGNIDTSQNATDLKFSRALDDLLSQRKQKESDLRSGVLQNESGIESQLGQNALSRAQIQGSGYDATKAAIAPYSSAVADRASQIDALFNQFRTPYTLQDTTPVAANLDTYQTPTTAINTGNNSNASSDTTLSPYLLALQKKFQSQGALA